MISLRSTIFWAALLLAPVAHAEESRFTTGPVIADYGPVADVEGAVPIAAHTRFKVVFDVSEGAEPGAVNRGIESAARFLNMHARAGVRPSNIRIAVVVRGSATRHNAEERVAAASWGALCFPRFYFYDALRGLAAVVAWAAAHGHALPLAAVASTIAALAARAPDGVLRVERSAVVGKQGWAPDAAGAWSRQPTTTWSLLDLVSQPGAVSPGLTRQWQATRRDLATLLARDQLTG